MLVEDIKKLPIKDLGEDNSVLFLWATAPKLKECLEVMNEWGYEYRTCAIWDKEVIGMGYWFRNQHEILLIGLRGKFSPPEPSARDRSVYRQKRDEHSKKPTYFRKWISDNFPNATKIELFARKPNMLFDAEHYDGWDVWGNEVDSDIPINPKEWDNGKDS